MEYILVDNLVERLLYAEAFDSTRSTSLRFSHQHTKISVESLANQVHMKAMSQHLMQFSIIQLVSGIVHSLETSASLKRR